MAFLKSLFISLSLLVIFSLLTSTCNAANVLYTGQVLSAGNTLTQGSYTLSMQKDCNLVLYANTNSFWATNTAGKGSNCYVTMQSDGNLVVYDGSKRVMWASNTNRATGNYVLVLQPDRNLVIYGGSIWSSKTTTGTDMVITGNSIKSPGN
ncbi:hypothetical protein LUZ60_012552 [Juncus effusus]|nr:hypothetical protein LUZ60_012552 [Juncus effusus]